MSKLFTRNVVIAVVVFVVVWDSQVSAATTDAVHPSTPASYGKLPLSFEANQGQSDRRVKFLARGQGYGIFLTPKEAVMTLRAPSEGEASAVGQRATSVVRMRLVGGNRHPQLTALDPQSGKSNYFIGADPAKWRHDVSNYARVKSAQVYPGIDLIYHGNQRQLEYDFVVAPGGDPRRIELAFHGIETLSLEGDGNLVLAIDHGQVVQHKPVIYQDIDGKRELIEGGYVLSGKCRTKFHIGRYDKTRPLVIDPVLVYSTYLGGVDGDVGRGIAVDGGGNAYVIGYTASSDFPTQGTIQAHGGFARDAFVAKLNAGGTALVYSTFLGGSNEDLGNGIALDTSGNAYITGETGSNDFPVVGPFQVSNRGQHDAFVAKLNPAGNALVYSTYLGGSFSDEARAIAVDAGGNAYVMGITASRVVDGDPTSASFPTVNAYQATLNNPGDTNFNDFFVTKFNAAGTGLIYSTYFGGSDIEPGTDVGAAIAVDGGGNAYVTGMTLSTDFPTTAGAFQTANGGLGSDAFVAKFASGGTLVYSTYLGGSGGDDGRSIAVDSSGNAYITGLTLSPNFPTASPYQAAIADFNAFCPCGDAFVTKLNPAGGALVYSTYLGGTTGDVGSGIALDGSGDAYVTGSGNPPQVDPIPRDPFSVLCCSFATKFNPAGSALLYSTSLSGFSVSFGIAVDGSGNAYITGYTNGNMQTVNPIQASFGGVNDAFVMKISPPGNTTTTLISSLNPSVFGAAVTFSATVSGTGVTGAVQFKDGASNLGVPVVLSGGSAGYTTSALTAGTHTITGVYGGDASFFTSTSSAVSQVVQTPFGAPTALTATSTGLLRQVELTWNPVNFANHYEVARRATINDPYVTIATLLAGTTYVDFSVAFDTTYLYVVRAVDGSGPSAYSNMDPATTVMFTEDPLVAVVTTAKGVHLDQLRTAVNAMRTSAALTPVTFTDPSVASSTLIKAIHIQELRTALDAARATLLLLPPLTYTDATLTAGVTSIKAAHFQELRNGTK